MSVPKSVQEVILDKDVDYGLGFNISGGVDAPFCPDDTSIFVARVKSQGAAHDDGRLKRGDKILSVDGKSLEGLKHHDAVQLFRKTGKRVQLLVQPGAARMSRVGSLPLEPKSGWRSLARNTRSSVESTRDWALSKIEQTLRGGGGGGPGGEPGSFYMYVGAITLIIIAAGVIFTTLRSRA